MDENTEFNYLFHSKITSNRDKIKSWVEKRGGKPAILCEEQPLTENHGVLRILFPGDDIKENVKVVTWDQFFERFDQSHLGFMYDEEQSENLHNSFFKFVSRNGE